MSAAWTTGSRQLSEEQPRQDDNWNGRRIKGRDRDGREGGTAAAAKKRMVLVLAGAHLA